MCPLSPVIVLVAPILFVDKMGVLVLFFVYRVWVGRMSDQTKQTTNVVEYDGTRNFRLTISDLAKMLNVPIPVIRSYIHKGLPHQLKGELQYFDLREAVGWWRDYTKAALKEAKSGRSEQQHFLRELIDGQGIVDSLLEIELELRQVYDEIVLLGERFQGANQHLLDCKGQVDPNKLKIDAALDSNKQAVLNAKVKVLESRRQGLENLLRKKLPDLRAIEVASTKGGASEMEEAFAMFAEAASKS